MKKVEEICKKFSSLKNILNESSIQQLCHKPFNSITKEIKRITKEDTSSTNLNIIQKNNPINSISGKSNN